MSWFGDGTFKQVILDEIRYHERAYGMRRHAACAAVAEVLTHLCETAFSEDEALAEAREQGRQEAKAELIKRLEKEAP